MLSFNRTNRRPWRLRLIQTPTICGTMNPRTPRNFRLLESGSGPQRQPPPFARSVAVADRLSLDVRPVRTPTGICLLILKLTHLQRVSYFKTSRPSHSLKRYFEWSCERIGYCRQLIRRTEFFECSIYLPTGQALPSAVSLPEFRVAVALPEQATRDRQAP
jgi:hypothetical protein